MAINQFQQSIIDGHLMYKKFFFDLVSVGRKVHQLSIKEALQGSFRERGEWGQKAQGAGSMASKIPGSREQKKVI